MLEPCLAKTPPSGRKSVSNWCTPNCTPCWLLLTLSCLTSFALCTGEPTTDITEQDGKRIIRRTGMYTGTELHLTR